MKKQREGYMSTGSERMSYWSYLIGQNFAYTMMSTYLTTYMMMQGVDLGIMAVIMIVVKVWDAVNDAIFGVIFDKIKFKSGNKCLPWIRISSVTIPLFTLIMYVIPQGAPEVVKLAWFTVVYLLFDAAYTVSDVPIYGMVTAITNNMDERNWLMSFGRIYGGGSAIVCSVIVSLLVSEKVGLSFSAVAIILSVGACLFMLPICFKGKERNRLVNMQEGYTLREMFQYLAKNRYLLLIYGSYILLNVLNTTNSLSLFTSFYLFGSATFSTMLVIIAAVPMLVMALCMPLLLRKIDKFTLYFWSLVLNAAIGFIVYFVGYESPMVYIAFRIVQVFPVTISGILAFMFTPDCAEYGEYETGLDARGITFAIQSFSTKLAGAFSSSIGLMILGLFGWVTINASSFAEIEALNIVQPDSAISGLWFTYTLVPSIGSALGIIPLFFYKLRDKDVAIMAKCNSGEITREEAEAQLSPRLRKTHANEAEKRGQR